MNINFDSVKEHYREECISNVFTNVTLQLLKQQML